MHDAVFFRDVHPDSYLVSRAAKNSCSLLSGTLFSVNNLATLYSAPIVQCPNAGSH
jgi:hypothetical protein